MTTKLPERFLAIIGGGASATLFLAHFAQLENIPPTNIIIFDHKGRFGKGIAYGTKNKNHLLNVRARDMSALNDQPRHFAEWAAKKSYAADTFVPRMIYAEYLTDIMDEIIEHTGKRGHHLNFIKADVTSVKKEDSYYAVFSEHGDYKVDEVLLATGNAAPVTPKGAENLKVSDGYHAELWSIDYSQIKGDVILLGTGLSAIDAILSLNAANFSGNITAISRRGLLPACHAKPLDDYPAFIKESPATPLEMLRILRAEVESAAERDIPWQAVVDSLRPFTNKIWGTWPEPQRKKFLKRLFAFWGIHRHRMPPEAYEIIQSLRASGRLRIVRDSVEKIESGITVQGRAKTYEAPHVINCLGYAYGAERKLDGSRRIGPAAWGSLLETTSIPEIREQAATLAEEFTKKN